MSYNPENITLVITPFIPELNDFDETLKGNFNDDEDEDENLERHENSSLSFVLDHFNSRNWNNEMNELLEFAEKVKKVHCYNINYPEIFLYNESDEYHISIKYLDFEYFTFSMSQWDSNDDLVNEYEQEGLSKNQIEKIIQLFYSKSYSEINKIKGTLSKPELQLFLEQRHDKKIKREVRSDRGSWITYIIVAVLVILMGVKFYKLFFK